MAGSLTTDGVSGWGRREGRKPAPWGVDSKENRCKMCGSLGRNAPPGTKLRQVPPST